MSKSLRKLKKEKDFHGRLFHDQGEAARWLERMQLKHGFTSHEYGIQPWKAEDNTYLTLAYLHRSKTDG